jgi:hypothetical protein
MRKSSKPHLPEKSGGLSTLTQINFTFTRPTRKQVALAHDQMFIFQLRGYFYWRTTSRTKAAGFYMFMQGKWGVLLLHYEIILDAHICGTFLFSCTIMA